MLEIYTDGSTSKNGQEGSNGSFGVVVIKDGNIINAYSSERIPNTTNNRQEMLAILWAYENYGVEPTFGIDIPIVYSDSAYAVNTFTTWMHSWKNNGWRRSNGDQVENLDLVKKYDMIRISGKEIELRQVKGHADCLGNNLADQLATKKITVEEILKKE